MLVVSKRAFSVFLAMQSYSTLSIELHDSNVLSQVITSKFHEFRRHHLARIGVKHFQKKKLLPKITYKRKLNLQEVNGRRKLILSSRWNERAPKENSFKRTFKSLFETHFHEVKGHSGALKALWKFKIISWQHKSIDFIKSVNFSETDQILPHQYHLLDHLL